MKNISWRQKYDSNTPWSEVRHSYGPASDLPDLFDRAGSSDSSEAAAAVSEISMRICHQGMAVEEATAQSIPVLAIITEYASTKGTERIIRLLYSVSESLGTWSRISRQLGEGSRQGAKAQWEVSCFTELKNAVEVLRHERLGLLDSFSAAIGELEQSVIRAEGRVHPM